MGEQELINKIGSWEPEGNFGNKWYRGNPIPLIQFLQKFPATWISDSRLKYLKIHIDTRNCDFLIFDRDGKQVSVEEIYQAAKKVYNRHKAETNA